MNVGRIFANAIARRVAYVLVALVLGWIGVSGDASAQTNYENCLTGIYQFSVSCPNRQDAYAGAKLAAHAHNQWANGNQGVFQGYTYYCYYGSCIVTAEVLDIATGDIRGGQREWKMDSECPTGYFWDDATYTCGMPCDGLSPLPAGSAHAPGDSQAFCQDGCSYSCSDFSLLLTIDGELRTVCAGPWETAAGATCTAGELPPLMPVNDSDGDGTSDEYDLSPNNPGESGDGSGQDVSRACGGPGQPECLPDGSNEGSGRGNTSGGGGDCNTPPRSSGDAILAQIAFQTWATRCAIVATANQGSGTGTGEGEGDQPNWTKGEGPEAPVDDTDYVTQQTRFGLPVSTDLLDQENIFGSASCEHFSIPIWRGVTVSTSDFDGWCTLQAILRGLILIFGAFTAIQILLGKW